MVRRFMLEKTLKFASPPQSKKFEEFSSFGKKFSFHLDFGVGGARGCSIVCEIPER